MIRRVGRGAGRDFALAEAAGLELENVGVNLSERGEG
jgi:hypothetical protein